MTRTVVLPPRGWVHDWPDNLVRLTFAMSLVVVAIVAPRPEPVAQAAAPSTSPRPIGTAFPISGSEGDTPGKNAIAFDGTNFLLVWHQGVIPFGIYGARVSTSGNVLDPNGFLIAAQPTAAAAHEPSVAFDGTDYMVVWMADPSNTGVAQLYGARVAAGGTVLDPGGVQVTQASPGVDPLLRMPSIAFDGTNHLVAWRTKSSEVRVTRMSTDGVNLDDPSGTVVGHGYYPYVSYGDGNYLVAWHDGTGYCRCWIMGAIVSTDGTLAAGPFQVAPEGAGKDNASIAFDGANFLVVWHDFTGSGGSDTANGATLGTRVSPDGTLLDDPPIEIADDTRGQNAPRVVFDGTNYLVVWVTENNQFKFRLTDVFARRVSPAGTILDPRALSVATAVGHQFAPVVGYGAGRFLIAWAESLDWRCDGQCVWGQLMATSTEPGPIVSTAAPVDAGWSAESVASSVAFFAIAGWSSTDAYAVGDSGIVAHRDSTGWSVGSAPSGRLWGAWATSPHDLWTVGWVSDVLLHDDAGWQDTGWLRRWDAKDDGALQAIWAGRSNIVAVGTRSTGRRGWTTDQPSQPIYRYDGSTAVCPGNTGQGCIGVDPRMDQSNWLPEEPGIAGVDFFGVWGPASRHEYAVGEFGTVVHFDGTAWHPVPVPTYETLNAIWGSGSSDIFVVGDSGTLLHYDGSAWTVQQTPTAETLTAVWGSSPADVYAVGLQGTILHYDGSSWTPETTGTTASLYGVWGADGRVYAVGDLGTVLSKPAHMLVVSTTGGGVGTVISQPAGISCGGSCSMLFDPGSEVTLSATPDASSTFAGWSGECTGTGTCQVTMDQARSVTATFNPETVALSVSKPGTGTGSVASDPAGVSCGVTCQASFAYGTPVSLIATPDASSTFAGWSGGCTGTETCQVMLDQARSVTATFTLKRYRPDALLRPRGSTVYVGDGRYNTTGAGQTATVEATRGSKMVFFLRFQNDGNTDDSLTVRGSGKLGPFAVRYLQGAAGTTVITSRVTAGTYIAANLAPGAAKVIRLEITVGPKAKIGALGTWLVTVGSVHNPARRDAVKAELRAAST